MNLCNSVAMMDDCTANVKTDGEAAEKVFKERSNAVRREKVALNNTDVKVVVANCIQLAASELKKNCTFKFCGCLNLLTRASTHSPRSPRQCVLGL